MNTIAYRLTHLVMIAAALSACFIVKQAAAGEVREHAKPIMLPRVVVTGTHVAAAPVVQLPRVVVVGTHVPSPAEAQKALARRDESRPAAVTLVALH